MGEGRRKKKEVGLKLEKEGRKKKEVGLKWEKEGERRRM